MTKNRELELLERIASLEQILKVKEAPKIPILNAGTNFQAKVSLCETFA